MEIKLDSVKGIGPSMLRILRNQGLWSTYDLVLNYPKRYEDFSITSLEKANDKETITTHATIISELKLNRFGKGGFVSFKARILDKTIDIVAFGKGYLIKSFAKDEEVIIKGVYHLFKRQINASAVIKVDKKVPLKPIYGIEGIHDKTMMNVMETIFLNNQVSIFETIPKEYLEKYKLLNRLEAYQKLHLPKTIEDIHQAERRFKYEEAFYLQLRLASKKTTNHPRPPKPYDIQKVKDLISTIPFELTGDQKEAVNDIFRDFKKDHASYRLIQGDVGSGKTMVALISIYAVITANEQVSLMAPTELLANQHYQYFKSLMKDANIALLTSKTKNKIQLKEDIKNGKIDLLIGTHALIENDVIFKNLGLVVIDEQHKFGVNTREELIIKSNAKDVIYLTATPIPRTLALIAFGDSHVSVIKEKPKHRILIETKYITKDRIQEMYDLMHSAIIRKEHIFLVVPAITSEHVTDNIETVYEEIKEEFSAPIFVLHGKLPYEEKELIMEQFIYTPGSILLSTTMIEVGIDIPTATFIGIYAAESFGLSQLHQLRGRVGRGNKPSFCYLLSTKEDIERLDLLSKVNDGFQLSEYDLISRGPGDFLGVQQSGYLKFNFLDLATDYQVLIEAQKNVQELLSKPDFKTNTAYKYLNKYMIESIKI
ncbi:MAG: ATP-dependent DNA helicase RecG [Acholeplasmataceae bacterium]|nr:ATP-dependent DNA helicase RecG [Acholeplasmataceae bacterium]